MKNKVYWKTKDGRLIDVDKWDDLVHMRNILKILIKEREEYSDDYMCSYGETC